jgi:RNA polymerase sigma-70 factor, ECF subfamily
VGVEHGTAMSEDPLFDGASDDELVAGIGAGSAGAFAALYRRHKALVYRFALHMGGTPALADDVTQEVFLAVMGDARRYEPGRSVAAWLYGITRNHTRRRLERDRRTVPLDDPGADCVEMAAPEPGALEELTTAEGVERVRRAVLALPLPYREAVVLCDLQELSYADAAAALGCALGTVRSRLHRGRALLAAALHAGRAGPRAEASGPARGLRGEHDLPVRSSCHR